MSIAPRGNDMVDETRKRLLDEHVRLTTQFVSGNLGAAKKLAEIEKELGMGPDEIARIASNQYLREY